MSKLLSNLKNLISQCELVYTCAGEAAHVEPTDISSMHRRSQHEAQPWEENPWGPYTPRGQPTPLEAFVQRAVAAASEREVSSSGNTITAVAQWEPAVSAAREPSSPGSSTAVEAHWGSVVTVEGQPESSRSNAAVTAHWEPASTANMPRMEAQAGVRAEASAAHRSPASAEAALSAGDQAGAEQSRAAQLGHGGMKRGQHQSADCAERQQRGSTDSNQLAAARQRWQWELEERQAAAPQTQLEASALPAKSLETEQELEDAIVAVHHASQAAGQQEQAPEPAGHVGDSGDASAAQSSANWWWQHADYSPPMQPAAGVDRLVQVPESLLKRYHELEWADWRRRYQQWQHACTVYYEQSAVD